MNNKKMKNEVVKLKPQNLSLITLQFNNYLFNSRVRSAH